MVQTIVVQDLKTKYELEQALARISQLERQVEAAKAWLAADDAPITSGYTDRQKKSREAFRASLEQKP